nr:hypothetical protein [Tanacetum cinerariifolium]
MVLLATIFKLGHPPDLATYNTLIRGLVLADQVFEAVELFKKLIRDKLYEPDQYMYGTVINGLYKVGHTTKALKLLKFLEKGSCKPFNKMIGKGVHKEVITYNSLIHGLCNFGKENKAVRMLIDMEK